MTDEPKIEELREELDVALGSIGRFAAENSWLRKDARKHYEKQRQLEDAIRRHAIGDCGCKTSRECLVKLSRLVPLKPRKKYGVRVKVSKRG
jgi:hypothetical protein